MGSIEHDEKITIRLALNHDSAELLLNQVS